MKTEEIRELKFLTAISSGESPVTQRSLAKRQGVALGLVNLFVHRLAKKGFIKVLNIKGNRLRYLITPQGIAEKARLSYEYVEYSLNMYRHIRKLLTERLALFVQTDRRSVLIVGTGEVAEIAYLTLRQLSLDLVGVVDQEADHRIFLDKSVLPFSDLAHLSFDCVIVASIKDREVLHDQLLQAGIDEERIIAIPDAI